MKNYDISIVGAGLSGAVVARQAAEMGKKVVIIERRNHIAGNIFDYKDSKTGITVHKYGPHVFHTNYKDVWDFLSKFTKWHRFMYRVKAFIDGKEINIPFNLDSLYLTFPKSLASKFEDKLLNTFEFNTKVTILDLKNSSDESLKFLADYIYKKVFLGYTVKQWGVKPEDLDKSVSSRVPIFIGKDDRYFLDRYQAIPANGYTELIKNILNHPNIDIQLNTNYKDIKDTIDCDLTVYTGAIDEYYDYDLGALPYRSLDIVFETFNKEYYQSCPQLNFPENFDYTRSVEYKYYLDEKSDKTIVSFEYSCPFKENINERYYPIVNNENTKLYKSYLKKSSEDKNVFFIGRLGDYRYYNMDETVKRALDFCNTNLLNTDLD